LLTFPIQAPDLTHLKNLILSAIERSDADVESFLLIDSFGRQISSTNDLAELSYTSSFTEGNGLL